MTFPLQRSAMNYRALREEIIEAFPFLVADNDTLLDTLEGITDINEQLAALLRSAKQDEAMADGIKAVMQQIAERKSSLETRAHRKRQIALRYMEDLGIKNIVAPDMTISRRIVPPKVVITEEKSIPKEYLHVRYEPNKTAIKKALEEGKQVPGCTLSNTSETISIRI